MKEYDEISKGEKMKYAFLFLLALALDTPSIGVVGGVFC